MFHSHYFYNNISFYLLVILLHIGFISCTTDDECRKVKDVNMQLEFFTKTINATTLVTTNTALTIDSIWVKGLDKDSFIYKNKKGAKKILLPLKKFETQTDFVIRFNNITDTISIFYENNENYYLSLACGSIVTHSIKEAVSTNHYIKTIEILNTEINTINATNLQIFH